MYIPDLTERFPEGLDGVDCTDRYFPRERCLDPWDALAELERYDDREDYYEDRNYTRLYDESEEEEDEPYIEESKDMEKFYENWGDQIDEDELPFI